jgi:tetratricopeptide (TPR) repeat protein
MAKFAQGSILTPAQDQAVKDLKLTTYSNLALCYAKLGNLDKVVDSCEKALAINPKHVKCLIRIGSTLVSLGKFDRAKVYLMQAYDLEPKNELVLKELKVLKSQFDLWNANQKEKQKQVFGGKFLNQ